MENKSLVIIPAAGFGTRMGLLSHESKEMLEDPYNSNKPLIDWHLNNLKDYYKIVPTREEKEDLIDHLYKDPEEEIYVQLVKPTKEWPATILETSLHWEEKNILILPDTRFEPKDIVSKIDEELEDNDLVFAVHYIRNNEMDKWGEVGIQCVSKEVLFTQEKPDLKKNGYAWGIIGFKKHIGEELFTHYLNKTFFDLTKYKCSVIFLDKFADITRTGKIEQY